MTRICKNCNFENQDNYDYCAKCGTPLVEGLSPKTFIVYKNVETTINKKFLIISYLITIIFSFGGFVIDLIAKHTSMGFFSFFGFFMPFFLLQAKDNRIKKHGVVQLLLSFIGFLLFIRTLPL
ncbi:zinc ribbon domain-containing protein [uncultured Methanobrevibacter sp.]|uniref:zinc ribbon domain-containing protein n=1 Tax=uncultured Methanobrevibacter sp. TaxID=253161 RepID=UPI00262D84B3|nr:zinc ribbon domain-containing protein [uncultured Methanobrevibacter sp.]